MWSIWGSLSSACNSLLQKTSDALSRTESKERIDTPPSLPSVTKVFRNMAPSKETTAADADETLQFRKRKKMRRPRRVNDEEDSWEQSTSETSEGSEKHSPTEHPKYATGAQPFPWRKIGTVFWVRGDPVLNDYTDVDLPIDEEVLEDVVRGKIKLEKPPITKTRFDPFADVKTMMKDNLHFSDKVVFANTVSSTLKFRPTTSMRLSISDETKSEHRQLKWKDTVTICQEKKSNTSNPLKDVVKISDITASMI
uniref:Myosin N-terminal SH3-like domain-containing protein n=1 Tax=Steinernema glaseri TaxID=37863 RepID=A0A1I7YND2_9BILA